MIMAEEYARISRNLDDLIGKLEKMRTDFESGAETFRGYEMASYYKGWADALEYAEMAVRVAQLK